jgi:ferredoxin-NADP reductase
MFSTWLSSVAEPGCSLEVSAPRGSFFLRADDRPRLFVAGGTGLAPFLAMLRAIRNGSYRSVFPDLEVQYAAESDPPPGCHEGYGTDLIGQMSVDPRTQVYLCGPPPMVEAGREAMSKAGLRKGDALCERFA